MANERKKLTIELPTKDPDQSLKFELDPGLILGAKHVEFVTRNVGGATTVGQMIVLLNAAAQMQSLA